MKNFLKLFLISSAVMSLSSCKNDEHEHVAKSEYFVTDLIHGHKCSVCDEILDQEEHKFACVPNKKYKVQNDGTKYYKSCAKCGKVSLETFDISSLNEYSILNEPEVTTLDQIINKYSSYITEEMQPIIDLAKALQNQYIGHGEITYKRYVVSYKSIDYENKPITLSGAITIPCLDGNPKINGLIVDSHPTVPVSDAPSKGFDITSIPAIIGLAEFEPDLIGMGLTENKIMDYHCRHLVGRNTADGVTAFIDILNEKLDIDTCNMQLFNTGYSQGGYDSMAFLRYMEQDATNEEKALINITKTYSGSGTYSPQILFEEAIKKEKFGSIEYILMAVITMFNYHPDVFKNITMNDILTDYGMEFIDPINSHNDYQLSLIKNRRDANNEVMGNVPSNIFKIDNINTDPDVISAINKCFDDENLLKDWMPKGNLYIAYTLSDELVNPKCSLKAIETFKDLPNFFAMRSLKKDHGSAAIDYYLSTLTDIKGKL